MTPTWLPHNLAPLWAVSEVELLRGLIMGEAEGEPFAGKCAVADVVVNRVLLAEEKRVTWWGRTLHEVALKPHQFSCFYSDWRARRHAIFAGVRLDLTPACKDADRAARHALDRLAGLDGTGDRSFGATHYFAPKVVRPTWARNMTKLVTVGGHDFYREGA